VSSSGDRGSRQIHGWAPLLALCAVFALLAALLPSPPGPLSGAQGAAKIVPCKLDPTRTCERCPTTCCPDNRECCCRHRDACTCPRPEDIPSDPRSSEPAASRKGCCAK